MSSIKFKPVAAFFAAGLFCLGLLNGCDGASFMGASTSKKNNQPAPATDTGTTPATGDTTTPTDGIPGEVDSGGAGGTPAVAGGDPVPPGTDIPDVPISSSIKNRIGQLSEEEFSSTVLTKNFTTSRIDSFWVVTHTGNAYYFTIEGTKLVGKKKWTFKKTASDTGSRTYVLEGGSLVFVRNGGHVWWIDPVKTPEGALDETLGGPNHTQIPNITADHRGCPVSYKKDGKRYIGIGISTGKFALFSQEDTPPYRPAWNTMDVSHSRSVNNQSYGWGYSCYIDQTRLIYYGQWYVGGTLGLNLTSFAPVDAATAPNGALVNKTENTGSYALYGDRSGNVYNVNQYYTFTHDGKANVVWGTTLTRNIVEVTPDTCRTTGAGCAQKFTFDVGANLSTNFGPISALPAGGVIAISRGDPGQVYLLRLKDPANIAAGIEATKLDTVEGDPYMYNDFTGATLYSTNADLAYDLTKSGLFKNDQALALLVVSWEANPGAPTTWEDAKLEVRCFNEGEFPPNFAEVANMKDAGVRTFVQVGSCRNKDANKVELKVTQLNGKDTITRIKNINVFFYQGN
jgi:hypothetical protein